MPVQNSGDGRKSSSVRLGGGTYLYSYSQTIKTISKEADNAEKEYTGCIKKNLQLEKVC